MRFTLRAAAALCAACVCLCSAQPQCGGGPCSTACAMYGCNPTQSWVMTTALPSTQMQPRWSLPLASLARNDAACVTSSITRGCVSTGSLAVCAAPLSCAPGSAYGYVALNASGSVVYAYEGGGSGACTSSTTVGLPTISAASNLPLLSTSGDAIIWDEDMVTRLHPTGVVAWTLPNFPTPACGAYFTQPTLSNISGLFFGVSALHNGFAVSPSGSPIASIVFHGFNNGTYVHPTGGGDTAQTTVHAPARSSHGAHGSKLRGKHAIVPRAKSVSMTQSGVFAPIAPLLVNGGRMYYLTTFETSVESGVTRGTRVSGVADNLYLLAIDHHASILGRIHWTWQMQVPAPMSAGTSATPPLAALSLPAPNTLLLATVQNQTWGRNSGSTASVCGIADNTADLAAVPTLLWQVRMNVTCGSANSSNAVACLRPWMIADVASAMSPLPVWVMLDAAQPTFLYMNASTGSTLARVQVSQAVAGASPMACPLASNLSAPGARLTARAMPLASLASASGTGANDTTPGLLIVAQYAFSSSVPSARSQLWLIALRTQTSGAANVAWCSYVSDLLAPAYGGVDTSSHMAAMLIPAQSSGLAAMKSSGTPSMSTLLLVPTATEIVAFG